MDAGLTEGSLQWRVMKIEDWKTEQEKTVGSHTTDLAVHKEKFAKYDETIEEIVAAQRSINNWLRGIFGSVFVALILLVAELITHARAGHP